MSLAHAPHLLNLRLMMVVKHIQWTRWTKLGQLSDMPEHVLSFHMLAAAAGRRHGPHLACSFVESDSGLHSCEA
jgi:hypothetical protein